MINRILIRIKVVQMLYSYLLVKKDFALEPQPTNPTREKRFSHALYLDYLALMVKVADRLDCHRNSAALSESRFIKRLRADERMHSLLAKYDTQPFQLEDAIEHIADAVKASAIYKNYLKEKSSESNADIDIWAKIFDLIIAHDPVTGAIVTRRENYSPRGVENAGEMMRHTFTEFYSSNSDPGDAVRTLQRSLEAARELYFRLLLLPIDLTDLREQQLDAARHKYLPTEEDMNPNLRFVENQLVAALRENPEIQTYCKEHKLSWIQQDRTMLTALLRDIMDSKAYQEYMALPITDMHTDCELWRDLYKHVIFHNDNFLAELEDKSVFWNDDVEIIGTFLLKTLKRFDTALPGTDPIKEEPVLPMFRNRDDAQFGQQLLSLAIRNKDEYRKYIDANINKAMWDTDRIAFMDVVVLLTAITEIINFPSIPTTVSINEYIEIAKSYSSHKSGPFVHGMLGNIIRTLRQENIITKQ